MSIYKIIVQGPFFFGKSIPNDDVCSFCGELCTHKSSCSDRYHFVQGIWENSPEGVHPSEEIDVLPICDQCYLEHDIGEYGNSPNVIIFYNKKFPLLQSPTFTIDSSFRAND